MNRSKIIIYILSALVAGIAGVVLSRRLGSAGPRDRSTMRVLDVIAVSVAGEANLAGGKGTILGTFMGAIILAILSNALIFPGISSIWHEVLVWALLILAVQIHYFRKLLGRH